MHKLLFIHTVANTPYKHWYYNLFAKYFEIHVIHLAKYSAIRNWELQKDKKYKEYEVFKGEMNERSVLKNSYKIIKLTKRINPDVIITHGYHKLEFLLIPFFFRKKIKICEIATTYQDNKRIWLFEIIKGSILKTVFNYYFVYGKRSFKYLNKHLNISPDKIFTKGNFSHLQMKKYTILPLVNRAKRILYVGRISEEKNIQLMLHSFEHVLEKGLEDYKLTMIGNGPLEKKVLEWIEKSKFRLNYEFIGYKGEDDLANYYLDARIFILPSISEPWGQVLNEAMYFGLPLIVSNKCGALDDLCNANAFIFEANNGVDLVEKMLNLITDEKLQEIMGNRSLKIIENYSPKELVEKQAKFINRIINNAG